MNKRLLVTFIASLIAATSASGQSAGPPQKPPPANVSVATATQAALSPTRWVPGSVVSRDDAKVASIAPGRVMEIAEVGTVLKRGERIARLDDTSLRLRLDEARAEAGRAKAQRELASAQLARLSKLSSGTAVSQTQLDEARAQMETAAQALASAQARQRSIEHDLQETDIRAPFSGVVTERFAQRGEYLAVGAPVAHLVDTTRLEARVQAPLALAPRIATGRAVQLRLGAESREGTVRAVVPVGDERSRQFELRVTLPEGIALVGSAIEVALPETMGDSTLTVPRDALVLRESRTYVMRVKPDNTAERVEVTAGAARDALVEIRGDLVAGDRVIVRGAERLEPGQTVSIIQGGS